jgi:hypothetical protein
MLLKGTVPIRIYRNIMTRHHDLNVTDSQLDTGLVDIWALFKPSGGEIVDMLPGSQPAVRRAELWLDSRYDLDFGYIVQVFRPMVLDGEHMRVSSTLTSQVTAGHTLLRVASTLGFQPGDLCVVTGTVTEQVKLRSVGATSLTVYTDSELRQTHALGSTVTPCRFYSVLDIKVPEGIGPYRVATLMETKLAAISAAIDASLG